MVEVQNTGGWQNWETVSLENIELGEEKDKILRIEFTAAVNTNFIKFENLITHSKTIGLSEFNVYPNPACELLFVRGVSNLETCSIYNILGQKMANCTVLGNSINICKLNRGVYILHIKGYAPKKFIKN